MSAKLSLRLGVLLLLLLVCAVFGWLWWKDATSAVNSANTTPQIFVISEGENVRTIATRLKSEGLIKDQIGFFLKVKLLGIDAKLQAGDFRLNQAMDVEEVVQALTHGTLDVWITTLEGWRSEEIALQLAQELQIPESQFLKVAREGYMFPDTYLIPKDASAGAVVQIFENNFDQRVTGDIRARITSHGLTFEQGIILASIVEREGRTDTDRPQIAGILLKRLQNDWPLQVDATLQYTLGYQSQEKSWWKKMLYDEDKKIKSPYNTYVNLGLPPAPIANPGLSSIRAVAFPQETSYWYYLHDASGQIHYAETIEEHNVNIAAYLL